MHLSRAFFKLSDLFNHPLRNYKRYPGVIVERNLRYSMAHKLDNKFDVYYSPKAKDGPYPILFNIHGGGFVRGGKQYRSGFAKRFADRGWFVVNIDYRLAPYGTFPAATEDAILALTYVNALKDIYDLDLNKIVITGDSAGGYYASHLVAALYSSRLRKSLGLPEYKGVLPRGLLTFCAPFDVIKCFTAPTPFDISVDITNCVFGTHYRDNNIPKEFPFKDEDVNILRNVNASWCECLLIAAQNDSFCGGQIEDMLGALRSAGVKHDYFIARARGDSHCSHLLPFMKGTPAIMAKVDEFLERIKNEGKERLEDGENIETDTAN